MKIRPHRIFLLATVIAPVITRAQFVCVPGKNCSCKQEKVAPNLRIANPTKVNGTVADPTGAPIAFERTVVQVRDLKSQAIIASAVLDQQGKFDLGNIPAGQFRFLVFQQLEMGVRRLPLFNQSQYVSCSGKKACHLDIVLKTHGTDQPFEFCPPK